MPPPTPAQQKRRVLDAPVYAEQRADSFWYLMCECNKFRTTPAGTLGWCEHVALLVKTHRDHEAVGFNSMGLERRVHITLRWQKPYIDTLVQLEDPDVAGMRHVFLTTELDEDDLEKYDLNMSLGYIPQSLGRAAIIPLVRDWINEHMQTLHDIGCRHPAHSKSRFDSDAWEMLDKNDPAIWADILDIATHGVCRLCRELDADGDLPF